MCYGSNYEIKFFCQAVCIIHIVTGVTGGLAAPFLAAGIGTVVGTAGAAALGSTVGVAIIGSLFGVAGAGLGGKTVMVSFGTVLPQLN